MIKKLNLKHSIEDAQILVSMANNYNNRRDYNNADDTYKKCLDIYIR
jgi:hypothetical protein